MHAACQVQAHNNSWYFATIKPQYYGLNYTEQNKKLYTYFIQQYLRQYLS